jgi:hypothetical protein
MLPSLSFKYVLDVLFMTFVHEMTQKKFPWYRYTNNLKFPEY